jgi:hypothetical protein
MLVLIHLVTILLDPLPEVHIRQIRRTLDTTHTIFDGTQYLVEPNRRNVRRLDDEFAKLFNGRQITEDTIISLHRILEPDQGDTFSILDSWSNPANTMNSPDETDMAVLIELLSIIQYDTLEFIQEIRRLLFEIDHNSTNDTLLQQRLTYWRGLLNRLGEHLETLKQDVRSFTTFLYTIGHRDELIEFETKLTVEISNIVVQITQRQQALRADMGLLESKRAIAQANSIGKLTELGFLFIPISCVASTFSMQVNELSSGVPVGYFFLASVLTLFLVYTSRIALRSTLIQESTAKASTVIRDYSGLPEGKPIPNKVYLRYIFTLQWSPIGTKYLFPFSVFVFMLIPIAFIWTKRNLDISFRIAMFCFLFLVIMTPFIVSVGSDVFHPAKNKRVKRYMRSLWRRPKRESSSLQSPMLLIKQWTTKVWNFRSSPQDATSQHSDSGSTSPGRQPSNAGEAA